VSKREPEYEGTAKPPIEEIVSRGRAAEETIGLIVESTAAGNEFPVNMRCPSGASIRTTPQLLLKPQALNTPETFIEFATSLIAPPDPLGCSQLLNLDPFAKIDPDTIREAEVAIVIAPPPSPTL